MAGDDFESVRAELRRRGYLQRGVERFLLQDALRPRAAGAAVARLALRVGVLLGPALAVAGGLGLGLANGSLSAHPGDAAVLSLHLALPAILIAAVGFLVLAIPIAIALRASRRALERLALGLAVSVSAAVLLAVALRGHLLVADSRWGRAALAAGATVVAWFLGRVLYDGFLAVAARFARWIPGGFNLPRWALGAVALTGGALLLLPILWAPGGGSAEISPVLPTAPGDRVLLVGVDGVLAKEFDYLLARGDLPAIAARRAEGGVVLTYARPAGPPASLWTSIATGLDPAAHGVEGIDSYRPLGVAVPLVRSGPLRTLWRAEAVAGLCEYKAVLATRRRGWTFWELAARGGAPVTAINWWSTYPAEPTPGLVVAHGAYQLLAEHAAGAVEPPAMATRLAALIDDPATRALDSEVRSALPGAAADAVLDRAVRPDVFYVAAARLGLARDPRAVALYLPGLDIAADGWKGSDVAFADLVRATLTAVDRLIGEATSFATVVVVVDPARRGGAEGRALVLRRGCGGEFTARPEAIASSLVRALGLPQSSELPRPVDGCAWPSPPSTVPSYGTRHPGQEAAAGDEYLRNLEALGYL